MNKAIKGIVTFSTASYVPLNVPVNILLDKKGLPIAIHRISDGAGTCLSYKRDQKKTVWREI